MAKGKINVSVENIFPLIKKFLYSDHEIFLRELISNATDATLKLKHLSNIGEYKDDYGDPIIEVKIDKKNKRLHIIDQGIGMTGDEIKKYINEVAFSGAEEFLEKYKDSAKDSGIIGHFGLGFYSAFMVSDSVEIISKSHKKDPAVHWKCDGSPEYSLTNAKKTDRGTEIILNISKDSKSFLEENTIRELLKKYNRFMPVPIKFGQKEISKKVGEGKDEKEIKETIDDIINITEPAWTKKPKDLKDEDYINAHYVIMATKKGQVKKTSLEQYSRPRTNGINAITIREGDELLEAKLTTGESQVMLALKSGKAIRFEEAKTRPMGRGASGVRGITLAHDDDAVIGMISVNDMESNILVVSENGYGKRSSLEDYRITNRGGKGVKTISITDKTGHLVSIKNVTDEDDLMIINKSGIAIRMAVEDLRVMGRATQGVKLINLKGSDSIAAVAKVMKDEEEESDENAAEAEGADVQSQDENTSKNNPENTQTED